MRGDIDAPNPARLGQGGEAAEIVSGQAMFEVGVIDLRRDHHRPAVGERNELADQGFHESPRVTGSVSIFRERLVGQKPVGPSFEP